VKSDPPIDRSLTANEVSADPSILRHPDARHKTRNRGGQKGGASKRYIDVPFAWSPIAMLACPAYRVLSRTAMLILGRLHIELYRRGGKSEANGDLLVTYDDFAEYGIDRHAVGPAIRELRALGFVRVTENGSAGNAEHRNAARYLLTYHWSGSDARIEDSWRQYQVAHMTDEAVAVLVSDKPEAREKDKAALAAAALTAKAARERKTENVRAREIGARGGKARWKNKSPVMETPTEPVMETPTESALLRGGLTDFPVMESIPPSKVSRGMGYVVEAPVHVLSHLPWSPPPLGYAPAVWPIAVTFPINEHCLPGSTRAIIRGEMVQ
jgi:hypothetical protein